MNPVVINPSPSESARFGLSVGRLILTELDDHPSVVDAVSSSELDVVILRYPHADARLFAELMKADGRAAIFADCLMYWRRSLSSDAPPAELPAGVSFHLGDAADVDSLVRPIFSSYPSHYSANPLFDPGHALEGYVEWVTGLVASGAAECLVFSAEDSVEPVGFTIVDVTNDSPDIRFGGISPAHRGHGHYDTIINGSMNLVRDRGFDNIKISTQAHNLAVIKTWARQGWAPFESWTTVHLVRADLLR